MLKTTAPAHKKLPMRALLLVLAFCLPLGVSGQASQLAPAPDEHEYRTSFMYGLHFSTNGGLIGGLDGRYSWRMFDNHYQNVGLQMSIIKHPKELRVQSQANQTYIPYKLNYLMSVRPDYGHEIVLFRKAQEEGVHLNLILAAGPSIGITKPYYVLYADRDLTNPRSLPYNPGMSNERILGPGGIFDGMGELKTYLGMHIRPALNFEFGKSKGNGVGLEAGFVFERYFNTIPIMYGTANSSSFNSVYATFFYCKKF